MAQKQGCSRRDSLARLLYLYSFRAVQFKQVFTPTLPWQGGRHTKLCLRKEGKGIECKIADTATVPRPLFVVVCPSFRCRPGALRPRQLIGPMCRVFMCWRLSPRATDQLIGGARSPNTHKVPISANFALCFWARLGIEMAISGKTRGSQPEKTAFRWSWHLETPQKIHVILC